MYVCIIHAHKYVHGCTVRIIHAHMYVCTVCTAGAVYTYLEIPVDNPSGMEVFKGFNHTADTEPGGTVIKATPVGGGGGRQLKILYIRNSP